MRLDLYTAEDRAAEALAYYRHEQQAKYMLWCCWGGAAVGFFAVYLIGLALPSFLEMSRGAYDPDTNFWIEHAAQVITSMRAWIIGAIVGLGFIVWGTVSAQLIAIYQALLIGPLIGLIFGLIVWGVLAVFDAPSWASGWVPVILGGLMTIWLGAGIAMGALLPDTST